MSSEFCEIRTVEARRPPSAVGSVSLSSWTSSCGSDGGVSGADGKVASVVVGSWIDKALKRALVTESDRCRGSSGIGLSG